MSFSFEGFTTQLSRIDDCGQKVYLALGPSHFLSWWCGG